MAQIQIDHEIALCRSVTDLASLYDSACLLLEGAADCDTDDVSLQARSAAAEAAHEVRQSLRTIRRLVCALERLSTGELTREEIAALR